MFGECRANAGPGLSGVNRCPADLSLAAKPHGMTLSSVFFQFFFLGQAGGCQKCLMTQIGIPWVTERNRPRMESLIRFPILAKASLLEFQHASVCWSSHLNESIHGHSQAERVAPQQN